MNQTTATTTIDTHVTDLEALRLQLEEYGNIFINNENPEEGRERLLHTLQTNDCREIITAAVDKDDLVDAFVFAGWRGHVDILEAYLNHGINIDIKDKAGWTVLMYASYYKREQCARLLLDRNANVDVQNKSGETALMYASQCDFAKIVEIFLEKNANPDIQDNNGRTALMFASMFSHKETVQLLLNHNADIALKNMDGKTALDFAGDEEIKEMIRNHVTTRYLLK